MDEDFSTATLPFPLNYRLILLLSMAVSLTIACLV